jgi:Xaa-Pro aminopeptidase
MADRAAVKTSLAVQAARLKRLRREMARHELDGYLITHPADLWHMTGFSGHDSVGIVDAKSITIVSDGRYQTQLKQEAPHVKTVIRKNTLIDAVAETLAAKRCVEVGFEAGFTTVHFVNGLHQHFFDVRKAGKLRRDIDLVPMNDLILTLRRTKDAVDLKNIQQAIRIAQDGFNDTLKLIRVGMTENEIAGQLILNMRRRGASDASFQPIVGAGANAALPHYRAAMAKVEKNKALLIDWGAVYNGYCSDLTRTFWVGKPTAKFEKIYKVCLEAQMNCIAKIKPGMTCKEADNLTRSVIKKHKLDKYYGHGTGHGLGRDIHEEPRVHYLKEKDLIEPGQVVTIEPGIYLPGVAGVRIEDDILITGSGAKVLTSMEKSYDFAVSAIAG